jgi:protoporphyrinogen IX oxidase
MPWVLTFHLFGVIFWLGGLLVIASLMALVADEVGVAKERFIVAARRLFIGCNVGAAIAIVFGFLLIPFEPEVLRQGWLHVKLLLVLVLIVVDVRLYWRITALENEPASATASEFRIVHGAISALMLIILLLALLKPF